MNKILNLKSWYTLEQCSQRLSLELNSAVSPKDTLQLVSDRQLTISWLRNHKLYAQVEKEESHYTPIKYIRDDPEIIDEDWILDCESLTCIDNTTGRQSEIRPEGLSSNPQFKLLRSPTIKYHVYIPKHDSKTIQFNGPHPISLDLNQRFDEYINHLLTENDQSKFDFQRDHTFDPNRTGSIFGIILEKDGEYYEQLNDEGGELFDNEFPTINELVFVRRDVEKFLEKFIKKTPSTPSKKTTNKYIQTIGTLSEALINGLSGVKNKDASAVLAALDLKGIDRPISQKKLAEYLAEAYEQK